jgi:hypothetical protein
VVLNDGNTVYEHHSDGQRQEKASCLKDFRNRPYPVKLRITYVRGILEVRDEMIDGLYKTLFCYFGHPWERTNCPDSRGGHISEVVLYISL